MSTLPIDLKIERAERLLRMIEQDAPLLSARVAPLSIECQESARSHAKYLATLTRQEITRLLAEKTLEQERELALPASAD